MGHGGGSFWFRNAVPAMEQGFIPDSISTDMHKSSILIPQATMPLTMSKLLNIGMPLPEVIRRSTLHPALGKSTAPNWEHFPPAPAPTWRCSRWKRASSARRLRPRPHARTQRLRCLLTLKDGDVAGT